MVNKSNSNWAPVQHVIWAGLLLRLGVAVWNSFFGPSFGAGPDALGFHNGAVAYARGELDFHFYLANLYMYVLGMVYQVTAESLFLGSWLSCIAWLTSAGVLYKTMEMLSVDGKTQFAAMLVYCLLPSSILTTSVTLREAYELLAVNLAIYSALRVCVCNSQVYWALLLAAVVGLGMLHGALLVAGILILALTSFVALRNRTGSTVWSALPFAFLAITAYGGASLFLSGVFNIESGLVDALQARRDSWQQIARAHYSVGVRIESVRDLWAFVPSAFFHYWFEPLPRNVQSVADAALLVENVIRTCLLGVAVASCFFVPRRYRTPALMTVAILVATEALWALGTINWGTAARHHVPSLGLLVLAFAFSGVKAASISASRDTCDC